MANKGLVVGISDYLMPTSALTAPAPDARAWRDLLPRCGIPDVTLRTNAIATLSEVHDRLFDLFKDAQPREKRVFVYCGHGTVVRTASRVGDEALQLFHPEGGNPEAAALTDTELSAIIKAAKPDPETLITIVLDCCFAGGFDIHPASFLESVDELGEMRQETIFFAPLLSTEEFDTLLTVHRFGSLWDKGEEFQRIDPLVVAACHRDQRAGEMPGGNPPHSEFSGRAIPKLMINPNLSHIELRDAVNREMTTQQSVLLGNTPRRPHHPFFS
jgi:rhodanese-related sulfurtransferase